MTNSEPLQPPISADEKRTSTEKPGRRQVIVEMIKRRRTTSRSQETGHQREPAVEEIVKQAHELVDAYPQPSRLPDPVKCQVLSLGLRLHKNFGYETRYASDLEAQFERHAIANTKRTDLCTRLIKLLFRNDQKRTDVNRLSNTLRLAVRNKVEPYEMADFIKRHGGIVGCSCAHTTKNGKIGIQARRDLADLLQQAEEVEFDLPCAQGKPFSIVLVPKPNGKVSLVTWRGVSDSELAKIASGLVRKKGRSGWLKPGCAVPARETLRLRSRL